MKAPASLSRNDVKRTNAKEKPKEDKPDNKRRLKQSNKIKKNDVRYLRSQKNKENTWNSLGATKHPRQHEWLI